MEAIQHYFKTVERGNPQLTIDLPEGVDQAEVEVIVRPLHDKMAEPDKRSRFDVIQQYKGIFKDSAYQIDDYDVYDQ